MAVRIRDPRTPILAALMMTMALVAMDTTIVTTAIPQITRDLGGFSLVGWVFSVYLLAQTVTIPVYGKLADLYGRKPVLVVGVLVFLAGSALSAVAWNMLALVVFRALQGLGAGSIGATVNTVAGDLYEVEERGRIQGFLSSVWGISAVVAPAIGGFFAEYLTWRWIFLVNLPIGAVSLTLIISQLHERVERRPHKIDYTGAALLLLGPGLLILGLLQGGTKWPWLSLPSLLVFGGAVVATVCAVFVERRAAEPIMPTWLWSSKLTGFSYAATIGSGLLVIGVSEFLPTWAQAVLGLNPVPAGFVLAVMSMFWPTASALSARLYLRIGFRDTALIGAGFTVCAGVTFSLTTADSGVWQPLLGSAFMGTGMGLLTSALIVGLQSTVGWSQRGVITSGTMFSRFLGQSLGAAIFGAVMNLVLLRRLQSAPSDVREHVPHSVDGISQALTGNELSGRASGYLTDAFQSASHAVFLGLLAGGVVTLLMLLAVPRRFPTVQQDVEGSTG